LKDNIEPSSQTEKKGERNSFYIDHYICRRRDLEKITKREKDEKKERNEKKKKKKGKEEED